MSATDTEQSKQFQMALTTRYRHGQLPALKTKLDVTRKQALKHIGQLVTLCCYCCKAASTRLQHMLLSSARMCLLFLQESVPTVYRGVVGVFILHHVEVKAICCVVKPMTPVQSQPHGDVQCVHVIYYTVTLQGSSLECL